MPQNLFLQNVIAVIWDFDKTLIPGYMQKPLFKWFKVDAQKFWDEVDYLPEFYRERAGNSLSQSLLTEFEQSIAAHWFKALRSGLERIH